MRVTRLPTPTRDVEAAKRDIDDYGQSWGR